MPADGKGCVTTEPGLPAPVVEALRRGNKVEAIKLLRQQGGLGLKEAKDMVDASGIGPDDKAAPGEVKSGAGALWVVVVVLLALAGWYLSR